MDKGRYDRTSGNNVPESLSKLEQRERTLKTIRDGLAGTTGAQVIPTRDLDNLSKKAGRLLNNDPAPEDISLQYNMAVSETSPIDLGVFLTRNAGDPAIAVSNVYTDPLVPIFSSFTGILREAKIASPSKNSGYAQRRTGIQ